MKPLMSLAMLCLLAMLAPAQAQPEAAGPSFQVEFLDGRSLPSATLKALSAQTAEFDADGQSTTAPLSDLEQLRRTTAAPEADAPFLPLVTLQNGSQLGGSEITVSKRTAELTTPWGKLAFPIGDVRSLRIAPADEKLESAWAEMTSRDTRNDLLVVRKGDALDFVAGVVGDITEKDIKLLVREREVALPRERAFGVVYVAQTSSTPVVCEATLATGDRLRLAAASLSGDQLVATLGGATKLSIPLLEVQSLDFTQGKVKSLADLPMTQSQFATSPLLTSASFEVRRNRNSLGRVLRIGDREFPRGLWIHSGASAVFRLGREYRRLTATIGLDSSSTELPRIAPRVKVQFLADGQPLETREIAWDHPPAPLELDVTGVRELEVRVEPQREIPGVLEHFVLGEARVIK